MTKTICTMMGLKEKDIEEIHVAAHLHDIGKIGIPDTILNKNLICDSIDLVVNIIKDKITKNGGNKG